MNPAASRSQIFHVWFSTKGRKSVLHEDIRHTVLDEFSRVAELRPFTVLAVEAIEDHVHLLLHLSAGLALSDAMHHLKGASARAVFRSFPELKLDMRSNSLWQKGYGSRPVPPSEVVAVRRYIETQEERPLRH